MNRRMTNSGANGHDHGLVSGSLSNGNSNDAEQRVELEVFRAMRSQVDPPVRFQALMFSDPQQQLQAALQQVDALLAENATLKQGIRGVGHAVSEACRLALHEELTGLANRRRSSNQLHIALNRIRRHIEMLD